jgi:hypothetical protein
MGTARLSAIPRLKRGKSTNATSKTFRIIGKSREKTTILVRERMGCTMDFIALGLVPVLDKLYREVLVEYSLRQGSSNWPTAIARGVLGAVQTWWHRVPAHTLVDWAVWGTFCLALVGFGSIVQGLLSDTKDRQIEAKRIVTAGDTPRYNVAPGQLIPSDKEIYHAYSCRIAAAQARRMPIPHSANLDNRTRCLRKTGVT